LFVHVACVAGTNIDEEWKIFRDLVVEATGAESLSFFVTLKASSQAHYVCCRL